MNTSAMKSDLKNIVCFGDSITEVKTVDELRRWPTQLALKLNVWRPDSFRVFNRGVSGDTTDEGAARIESDITPHLPELVVVEFGVNDCNVRPTVTVPRVSLEKFRENLGKIHRCITQLNGRMILLAGHFPLVERARPGGKPLKYTQGNGKSYAENYAPYYEVVQQMREELALSIIDMPSIIERKKIAMSEMVIEDGIHLTAQGNDFYAESVFEGLREILG
ncbi:MAG: GDSL-type esterase/lipase family protein [Chthoniobacterales bacterium]